MFDWISLEIYLLSLMELYINLMIPEILYQGMVSVTLI